MKIRLIAGLVAAACLLNVLPADAEVPVADGPTLLFDPSELPAIRANTRTGPGVTWWADLKGRADGALALPVATSCERQLRYALPDLAFAYLVTADLRYAAKAREIHLGVRDATPWHPTSPDAGCRPIWGDYGWRFPQMLAQTALSLDWLRGSGVLSAADEGVVRADLLAGGRIIYDAQRGPEYGGSEGIRNVINYRLRNLAGLGIVANALRDTDEGRAWAAYVWADFFGDTGRGTPKYVHQMLTPDGIYKEGQAYYQDSFRLLIPYFVTEKRATGRNAFADPVVAAAFASEALIMMPDGDPPTVDTGWKPAAVSGGFGHWVAGQYPENRSLPWAAQRQGNPPPAGDQWYALAFYRPDLAARATPPAGSPTRFLTDGGYGMFRSDWAPDANYLFLNAEHQPDRSSHEQPDQTSFGIHAKGAYLAIDPGDGRNCPGGDTWVRSAASHNLVLVDGAGPRQVLSYTDVLDPATFDRTSDTGRLDHARVRMTYSQSGVKIARRVAMIDDRYFVVMDDLAAPSAHQYDWQLHLGPGGTLSADGTTFRTTNAAGAPVELGISVTGRTPVTLHQLTGQTNYTPGSCVDHPYLQARTNAADTGYTAVLYPRTGDEAAPTIGQLRAGTAYATTIDVAGRRDVVLSNPDRRAVRLAGVVTDARHAVVAEGRAFVAEEARVLVAAGRVLLAADRPVDLQLSYDPGAITGRIDVTGTTRLTFDADGRKVHRVELDGKPIPFTKAGGQVVVRVASSGTLRIS